MLIIPAIDLKDGRCVRLKQGDMSTATAGSIHFLRGVEAVSDMSTLIARERGGVNDLEHVESQQGRRLHWTSASWRRPLTRPVLG